MLGFAGAVDYASHDGNFHFFDAGVASLPVRHLLAQVSLDLLRHFLLHPDLVLTREQLMQAVWGIDYFGTPRTVDNFILRLREKLEDDPSHPRFETIRGVGYTLRTPPEN